MNIDQGPKRRGARIYAVSFGILRRFIRTLWGRVHWLSKYTIR